MHSQNPSSSPRLNLFMSGKHRVTGMLRMGDASFSIKWSPCVCGNLPYVTDKESEAGLPLPF